MIYQNEQREENIRILADQDEVLAMDLVLVIWLAQDRGITRDALIEASGFGAGKVRRILMADPKMRPELLRAGIDALDQAVSDLS